VDCHGGELGVVVVLVCGIEWEADGGGVGGGQWLGRSSNSVGWTPRPEQPTAAEGERSHSYLTVY
jgi:hypothetical protein